MAQLGTVEAHASAAVCELDDWIGVFPDGRLVCAA